MEPSGYHLPGPQLGEHPDRSSTGNNNTVPMLPLPRASQCHVSPALGTCQAAAGTHPRVQLPGTVTRRCCCGTAAPGAHRSGGHLHSSCLGQTWSCFDLPFPRNLIPIFHPSPWRAPCALPCPRGPGSRSRGLRRALRPSPGEGGAAAPGASVLSCPPPPAFVWGLPRVHCRDRRRQ